MWELIHAFTMVPGLYIYPNIYRVIAYKLFCLSSIFYHIYLHLQGCDICRLRTSSFLRLDLTSQLIACFASSKGIVAKKCILIIILYCINIDINIKSRKRTHIMYNGLAIMIASIGYGHASLFYWLGVIMFAILFQITKQNIYHSLMHLCSHIAFIYTLEYEFSSV